jgi:uncharacterized protein with HEPN domain
MPDEAKDAAWVWDMLNAAGKAIRSLEGVDLAAYLVDEDLRMAVERRSEIIGEAARTVSPGFQEAHPEIPWRRIVGLRNVLAHEYGEVRQELVFNLWPKGTCLASLRRFAGSNPSRWRTTGRRTESHDD